MSLSRWSNSCWYIYEPCGSQYTLEVCSFGQFSVPQILRRYHEIESRAKEDGYTLLERLELRAYLTSWALFKMKVFDRKTHRFHVDLLHEYGKIDQYLDDPWNPFDAKRYAWRNLPGYDLPKLILRYYFGRQK